jgi:hypothetical protein
LRNPWDLNYDDPIPEHGPDSEPGESDDDDDDASDDDTVGGGEADGEEET